MNAPDCICSPGRLPLGAFCAGRDDLEREALHDDRISIRAPRAGCDQAAATKKGFMSEFQSTRPVWGATRSPMWRSCSSRYFNPRAPCGARLLWFKYSTEFIYFNPRAPCGARRTEHGEAVIREKFQSTRPVWGATKAAAGDRPRQLISIHAPRVGRDGLHALFVQQGRISIHAPRVGRDAQPGERSWLCADFNPRAPCGARLWVPRPRKNSQRNFNPRAPCGARPGDLRHPLPGAPISIHAPRVGRDLDSPSCHPQCRISIHAPRVGRD